MPPSLAIADDPRWVEAHALAAEPTSWRREHAIGNDALQVIAVIADGGAEALRELAREFPGHTILLGAQPWAYALAGAREVVPALVHTLPDPAALFEQEGATPLHPTAPLDHLVPGLAAEVADARVRDRVWTAIIDGEPAAFAYARYASDRYFNVTVETIATARQLGLGTMVATALILDRTARTPRREPVFTAAADAAAARRLAARLGFVEVDRIWVAVPQAPGGAA